MVNCNTLVRKISQKRSFHFNNNLLFSCAAKLAACSMRRVAELVNQFSYLDRWLSVRVWTGYTCLPTGRGVALQNEPPFSLDPGTTGNNISHGIWSSNSFITTISAIHSNLIPLISLSESGFNMKELIEIWIRKQVYICFAANHWPEYYDVINWEIDTKSNDAVLVMPQTW